MNSMAKTGLITQRIRVAKGRNELQQGKLNDAQRSAPPKGGYILFFLVLGIALGEDLLDLMFLLIQGLGMGLSATAIGAPVGVALSFLGKFGEFLVGLIVSFTLFAYFAFIGGRFALRLVIMSIGFIIEAIPVLGVLPFTTITFVAAFVFGRIMNKVGNIVPPIVNKSVSIVQKATP
jgi:hypothetical protein